MDKEYYIFYFSIVEGERKFNKYYYNIEPREYKGFLIFKNIEHDYHVVYKNTNVIIACRYSFKGAKQAIDNLIDNIASDSICERVKSLKKSKLI